MLCAEGLAAANKQIKVGHEAQAKAQSNAESAARQADKLNQKLANTPKVNLLGTALSSAVSSGCRNKHTRNTNKCRQYLGHLS